MMVGGEVYSLQWRHFQAYLDETFEQLREDRDFCDVTLVSEDNEQIEAHKVILSSSSPFFQHLLLRNKHSHPLLYMRGINSKMLIYIMDFIYKGETELLQDELESFLNIAQELYLKGLDKFPNNTKSFDIKNKINYEDIINKTKDKPDIEPMNHNISTMDLKQEKKNSYKFNDEDNINKITDQADIEPMNQTISFMDSKQEKERPYKINDEDIINIITNKAEFEPTNETISTMNSKEDNEQPYTIDDEDIINIFIDQTGIEPIKNVIPLDSLLQKEQLNMMQLQNNEELEHQANTEDLNLEKKVFDSKNKIDNMDITNIKTYKN